MSLLGQREDSGVLHYFLGFPTTGEQAKAIDDGPAHWQSQCLLELVYDPQCRILDIRLQPDCTEGYWKMAISVRELDIAHQRLIANGVEVDTPRQVGDIAYLCHFNDPDGYCIELIQHDFLQNHHSIRENFDYTLGSCPAFLLVTYRVKDIAASIRFYSEVLAMRLLSRQVVTARGFTLYFFACGDEFPPNADIEHVGNREWLWRRPYTMIELQHIWGTDSTSDFNYRVGAATGFTGVSFAARNIDFFLEQMRGQGTHIDICEFDPILGSMTATVLDPDGYAIKLIDKAIVI